MVKDHSDNKKRNLLFVLHELLIPISRIIYMHHSHIVHTMAFGIPVVEHWLKQEIAK